jgi:protein phosphatase
MSHAYEVDTVEIPPLCDLLKHFGPSGAPMDVSFGALSHRGKVRRNNQDHYIVVQRRRSRSVLLTNIPAGMLHPGEDNVYIVAVADGMGGAAFGELASMMALRNAFDLGHSAVKWVFKVTDQEIKDLYEQLEAILKLVHRQLVEHAQVDKTLAGMGTTLTGAYMIGTEAVIAHVGDSRAYLYHDGVLRLLTRDHTVAQEMLDAGNPNPEAVAHHMLTNCLGGVDREVRVDFHQIHLEDRDRLLFCTDGLTNMVPEEQIAGTLKAHTDSQEACQVLIEQALEQGGKDNVTVVVASFTSRAAAA